MILTGMSKLDSFIQFLTLLFLLLFVCVITYFTTRIIAKMQKGQMNCKNVDTIETFSIAPNKYIQIVRIADKYVALAICKDTVTVITEVDKDSLEFVQHDDAVLPKSFKEVLEKVKQGKRQNIES